MAKTKRKKRLKRKKRFKPKNRTYSFMSLGPSLAPDELYLKLKFNALQGVQSPDGSAIGRIISGNGIICNPLATVQRPLGTAEWSNFYSKYQIIGSRCTLTVVPDVAAQTRPCMISLVPTSKATDINGNVQLAQQPYAKQKLMSEVSGKQLVLSSYMSSKKIFGYRSGIEDNSDFSGNFEATGDATNPLNEFEWLAILGNQGGGVMDVSTMFEVTYFVRLYDRNNLVQST